MAIRHLVRLLALPLFAFTFLFGWGLYIVGSNKKCSVNRKEPNYGKTFDLQFEVISQEEQYAK